MTLAVAMVLAGTTVATAVATVATAVDRINRIGTGGPAHGLPGMEFGVICTGNPGHCPNDRAASIIAVNHKNFLRLLAKFSQIFRSFLQIFEGFGCFWICLDPLGPVWMHSDAFGCIWMRSDASD